MGHIIHLTFHTQDVSAKGPVVQELHPLQGKFHLCIPFLGIAWPQSQFPHSCVCEPFIYSQDQSTYFPAAELADRSWKYINLSQIYECRNWETEHYNSILKIIVSFLGIHKWEPDIYIGFSPALHLQCEQISGTHGSASKNMISYVLLSRGRILERNPGKSLQSFPTCYSQPPLQLCLEIYISLTSRNLLQFLEFSYWPL
jgi:hypothetical protein